jgi:hypothetical protein
MKVGASFGKILSIVYYFLLKWRSQVKNHLIPEKCFLIVKE